MQQQEKKLPEMKGGRNLKVEPDSKENLILKTPAVLFWTHTHRHLLLIAGKSDIVGSDGVQKEPVEAWEISVNLQC